MDVKKDRKTVSNVERETSRIEIGQEQNDINGLVNKAMQSIFDKNKIVKYV